MSTRFVIIVLGKLNKIRERYARGNANIDRLVFSMGTFNIRIRIRVVIGRFKDREGTSNMAFGIQNLRSAILVNVAGEGAMKGVIFSEAMNASVIFYKGDNSRRFILPINICSQVGISNYGRNFHYIKIISSRVTMFISYRSVCFVFPNTSESVTQVICLREAYLTFLNDGSSCAVENAKAMSNNYQHVFWCHRAFCINKISQARKVQRTFCKA